MKRSTMYVWMFCWLTCWLAWPQTKLDIPTQTKNADFSGFASTKPSRSVASLPSTCTVGQTVFLTTGTPGTYECTATNTWARPAGGAGDVVGPATATDNAIALFNSTTGKAIKDSAVLLPTGSLVGTGQANTWTAGAQDFSTAASLRLKAGSGAPAAADCNEAAEVGRIYVRSDAAAANASHYVCANTAALTYAWELTQGAAGAGTGDVVGPAGAVDSNFAAFNTTTGKLIKDAGVSASSFALAAQGVTGGNSHDHSGGDGAQIAYSSLGSIPSSFTPSMHAGTHATGQPDALTPASIGAEAAANKGAANGYASLDAGATVPDTQIAASITRDSEVNVQGTANEIASSGSGVAPTVSIASTFRITGKTATAPVKSGTSAPASCTVGDLFYDTDAVAGRNLFGCTATDTWTILGDGGGAGAVNSVFGRAGDVVAVAGDYDAAKLDDFYPSASSKTISVRAGRMAVGSEQYTIASGGVTFTAGPGDCKSFISYQGIETTHCATGIAGTATGSMVLANVTTPAFPPGSWAVADWTVAADGSVTLDADKRAFGNAWPVLPGTGITVTTAAGVQQVAIDPTVVPQLGGANDFTGTSDFSAATRLRLRTGTGTPSSTTCDEAAEVGSVYVRSDAAAANASHYICSNTGASSYAWELTQGAAGGGAPTGAQYLTLATDAGLSAERVLTPRDGLTAVDGGAGSTYSLDAVPDPSTFDIHDDFCGGSTSSGSVGEHGWIDTQIGSAAASHRNFDGEANHPCVIGVSTGTANSSGRAVYIGGQLATYQGFASLTTTEFTIDFVFRFTAAPQTNKSVRVGLFDAASLAPAERIVAKYDTDSDTNWVYEVCSSSTCSTQDSGVAAGTTNWVRARIFRLSGDTANTVRFCLNACGSNVQLGATNVPTGPLSPGWIYANDADGTTDQSIRIDWFGMRQRGLTRW